ncbi:hypothetical protein RQP46_009443 [Phenoliferia psychrophenolica]
MWKTRASNITDNALFLTYLKQVWLPTASDDEIAKLALAYPDDPALGSPYNTEIPPLHWIVRGVYDVPVPDNSYLDPLINLAVALDPNSPAGRPNALSYVINWPRWTPGGAQYTFVDSESNVVGPAQSSAPATAVTGTIATPVEGIILTKDDFRLDAISTMNDIFYKYPF